MMDDGPMIVLAITECTVPVCTWRYNIIYRKALLAVLVPSIYRYTYEYLCSTYVLTYCTSTVLVRTCTVLYVPGPWDLYSSSNVLQKVVQLYCTGTQY